MENKYKLEVESCKSCPMIQTGKHENGQKVFFCQHPELTETDHFLLNVDTIYNLCPLREKNISIGISNNMHQQEYFE